MHHFYHIEFQFIKCLEVLHDTKLCRHAIQHAYGLIGQPVGMYLAIA